MSKKKSGINVSALNKIRNDVHNMQDSMFHNNLYTEKGDVSMATKSKSKTTTNKETKGKSKGKSKPVNENKNKGEKEMKNKEVENKSVNNNVNEGDKEMEKAKKTPDINMEINDIEDEFEMLARTVEESEKLKAEDPIELAKKSIEAELKEKHEKELKAMKEKHERDSERQLKEIEKIKKGYEEAMEILNKKSESLNEKEEKLNMKEEELFVQVDVIEKMKQEIDKEKEELNKAKEEKKEEVNNEDDKHEENKETNEDEINKEEIEEGDEQVQYESRFNFTKDIEYIKNNIDIFLERIEDEFQLPVGFFDGIVQSVQNNESLSYEERKELGAKFANSITHTATETYSLSVEDYLRDVLVEDLYVSEDIVNSNIDILTQLLIEGTDIDEKMEELIKNVYFTNLHPENQGKEISEEEILDAVLYEAYQIFRDIVENEYRYKESNTASKIKELSKDLNEKLNEIKDNPSKLKTTIKEKTDKVKQKAKETKCKYDNTKVGTATWSTSETIKNKFLRTRNMIIRKF